MKVKLDVRGCRRMKGVFWESYALFHLHEVKIQILCKQEEDILRLVNVSRVIRKFWKYDYKFRKKCRISKSGVSCAVPFAVRCIVR